MKSFSSELPTSSVVEEQNVTINKKLDSIMLRTNIIFGMLFGAVAGAVIMAIIKSM